MTTITLDPASRAAMLAGAYAARHSQREVSEAEIEGLARACLDSARPEAVLAKLALDVAINDGGLDWPESHRRAALATYGLQPVSPWCLRTLPGAQREHHRHPRHTRGSVMARGIKDGVPKVAKNISLPVDLSDWLRIYAAKRGVDQADVVREALEVVRTKDNKAYAPRG